MHEQRAIGMHGTSQMHADVGLRWLCIAGFQGESADGSRLLLEGLAGSPAWVF